jgi:capsular polysaccharide biosynthesis protein
LSILAPEELAPVGLVSVLVMLPVARLVLELLEPAGPDVEPVAPVLSVAPLEPAVLPDPMDPVDPLAPAVLLEPDEPVEEPPPGMAPDWVPPEPEVPGMPAPAASLPDGPE